MKIERLTPEQEIRLVTFRQEWLKMATSCEPANFEEGEKAIASFYKRLGKPAPKFLRLSSPAVCEMATNLIFEGSELWSQLGSQLWIQLDSQLGSQLWSQLDSQLWSQLDSQLWSQLDSQLRSQLRSHKPYFLRNKWAGAYCSAWQAFYVFISKIGVVYKEGDWKLLQEWVSISQSIGWWAAWDGLCIISDRPREIHFDDNGLLHNEKDLAVKYSDGWGCASWHGTAIPVEWVTDRASLDAKTALTWPNMEQRRVACADIVGWSRILKELKAKVIDEDGDPQIGTLVEVKLPDLERPARFCRVQCGTGREFALGVPPEINTALEAQAWIHAVQPKDFIKPEIRT